MPGQGIDGVNPIVLPLEPEGRPRDTAAEGRGREPLVPVVRVQRDRACGLACGLIRGERREVGPEYVPVGHVEGQDHVVLCGSEGGAVDDEYRHLYRCTRPIKSSQTGE